MRPESNPFLLSKLVENQGQKFDLFDLSQFCSPLSHKDAQCLIWKSILIGIVSTQERSSTFKICSLHDITLIYC